MIPTPSPILPPVPPVLPSLPAIPSSPTSSLLSRPSTLPSQSPAAQVPIPDKLSIIHSPFSQSYMQQ
ncbi:unnamed protein product [Rotaria sordida]|uniref:Uncharacterized protein n=1 Tax=Rotaria sordida TaxID=392033 RepID=A0A814V4I0_9BILA|nr:unnamed protein product [Rotaria sordida]CAF1181836.1 unnamed protein product [Rotaria sordida]